MVVLKSDNGLAKNGVMWRSVWGNKGLIDSYVPFLECLHHLVIQLVKHVTAIIAREGAFSRESSVDSQRRKLSIGFWKGRQFVCIPIIHFGRDVSVAKSNVDLTSWFANTVSGDETIIDCGG